MPMPHLRRLAVYAAAVLVLGLLILVFLRRGRDERSGQGSERTDSVVLDTALVRQLPGSVAAYLAECGQGQALSLEPIAFQEELTRCIAGLTAALEAIMRSDTAKSRILERQFSAHRQSTERILRRQGESLQTAPAREMLSSAAVFLAYLWEARYAEVPGLAREVAQVRRGARELDDRTPVFDQRDEVQEILDRAGNAILLMAREEVSRADPG